MARSRPFAKMRRYKRVSNRRLSVRDLAVLDFLWTWKVASFQMLKEVAFKNKSIWWAYKAIRQLRKEKLIEVLPRGKFIAQELFTLTESGFEIVLMDRDDIQEYRYRVHAPAHDYLATCFQLGDLWRSSYEPNFITEQMLASISHDSFPKDLKETKNNHVPDGITVLSNKARSAYLGYEVDLNFKNYGRYTDTARLYKWTVEADLVFWLVKNQWMANKIDKIIIEHLRPEQRAAKSFADRIVFILLDDFKLNAWEAKIVNGPYRGETVKNLHAKILQSLGKDAAKLGSPDTKSIFFGKYRSPQKSKIYEEMQNAPRD